MARAMLSLLFVPILLAFAGGAEAARPARPAVQDGPSFTLVNRTRNVIRELFVTPSGRANWGKNRLDGKFGGATSMAPGAGFVVRRANDAECVFDMRVVFADGRAEQRRGVNVCARTEITVGAAAPVPSTPDPATGKPADDPTISLFNRAAIPVIELFATPSGLTNWGRNRLDQPRVLPDHRFVLTLPRDGNCIYDLKVVFADKKAAERRRTNLCRIATMPVP